METKHKNLLIGGLLAIVLIMAVGYAAFATQLNINGTANITSKWNVYIESITPGTPVGTASNKSATLGEDKLSATFETDLVAPGDALTYTVVVKNGGTLPAKLSAIRFDQSHQNTATEEGKDNRTIIYSYSGISENAVLPVDGSVTFTVTVTYNPAITTQPSTDAEKTSTLDMQLTYVQDTTTATDGE